MLIFFFATKGYHKVSQSHTNNIGLTWYGDAHGGCSIGIIHLTCEGAAYNRGEVTTDNREYIVVGGGSSICQGLHELVG